MQDRRRMGSETLRVALLFPRITVQSGGVEQTLKLIEHSSVANLRYTALLTRDNILSAEVNRRLEALVEADRLEIRELSSAGRRPSDGYDAAVITSEFWMPALRKTRGAGIRAPLMIKFHQLPYVGTLDILKTVGIDEPTRLDLVRVPFLSSRILRDSLPFFLFQMGACLYSVRSLERLKEAKVMAVTTVTSKNLRSMGFRRDLYVPDVHIGMEADRIRRGRSARDTPKYDGVYVGRFHPHKGFLDLPAIVARMKKSMNRDVTVAVCGSPQFPRHLEVFRDRVRDFGVEDNLAMLGWRSQDELYATIRESKALLYPSYVDAFSITVLESLCLGVPVVAYDIDALRMIWAHRKGVFLSPVGDPESFARLYGSIASDSRLESAREQAETQATELLKEYTWERAVLYERDFYELGAEDETQSGRG